MEIINTPISPALISSFGLRRQWDLTKNKDVKRAIAREDNPEILTTLLDENEEFEGSLTVWSIMYDKLNVKVSAGKGDTEYARLSTYVYTVNFVVEASNARSYYYMQGANYALLESYSLLRLVP